MFIIYQWHDIIILKRVDIRYPKIVSNKLQIILLPYNVIFMIAFSLQKSCMPQTYLLRWNRWLTKHPACPRPQTLRRWAPPVACRSSNISKHGRSACERRSNTTSCVQWSRTSTSTKTRTPRTWNSWLRRLDCPNECYR